MSSFIRFWGTEPTYKLQNYIREAFKKHWLIFACFHAVKVLFNSSDWYTMRPVEWSIQTYEINDFFVSTEYMILEHKQHHIGQVERDK